MNLASRVIKDSLTMADGDTYDLGRIFGSMGMLTFLGLSIWDFAINRKFDPTTWGTGFGLAVAGFGAMQALKLKSEQPQT